MHHYKDLSLLFTSKKIGVLRLRERLRFQSYRSDTTLIGFVNPSVVDKLCKPITVIYDKSSKILLRSTSVTCANVAAEVGVVAES